MSGDLESLEKRISVLEQRIFGDADKEADYPKIVDTLGKFDSQMKKAVEGRPKINTVIKRLDQLESLLDPAQMESLMLSQDAKADIILAEEQLIRQQAENLQKIQGMQDILGSEHIKAVPDLQEKLHQLSSVHLKQQDSTVALSEDVKDLLRQYNSIVSFLACNNRRDVVDKTSLANH
ncbi:hypothetical protein CAPTEDRAFT_189188 [Capitella teleta]|uniref:Dynactin subunit 3 n=1 Tax=Capitella teleta TaxID=283909 RepID=R7UQ88_CAPTE|nr:hypothetical protein CAPTEDRAFT_189188 [Capitella teleta]|eukprot:ELU08283.1 hypothetical protein CAPTEDRAFT_189188 [Capitella teleta]